MGNKGIFDFMAGSYDTPDRVNLANVSAAEIRRYLFDTHDKSAIDFGCGTGLVGIDLSSEFRTILFLDSSEEMIAVVKDKLRRLDIKNAEALCFDLELEDIAGTKCDYIFMAQVLLHIKNYAEILKKLTSMLNKDGHLIIVDFDSNNSVTSDLVHNGFDQEELKRLILSIGYADVITRTFYSGSQIFMGKDASMFVLDAKKLFD